MQLGQVAIWEVDHGQSTRKVSLHFLIIIDSCQLLPSSITICNNPIVLMIIIRKKEDPDLFYGVHMVRGSCN